MLAAFRCRARTALQRAVLFAVLAGVFILIYSYVNLEFCYKVMSQNSLTYMCKKFKSHEYSGSLCEELCGDADAFKEFKCPRNEMKTILFTAEKNGDVYAVKRAKSVKDDLGWVDSKGATIYPKIEEFLHIIKMHIMLSYNVTLEDNMIRALVNQEIDKNNPEQMLSFWRLFKDNNYMMGKLFDEEGIFPAILGSCGPYYATENLNVLQTDQSLMQYISFDWKRRLKFALNIMEYILRLDEMKPEPLKMCKMHINLFGLTADKRVKYQSAEYVQVESQVDKRLSSGAHCVDDEDCNWHACMGKCDAEKLVCNGVQQNNNLQIYCAHLLRGGGLFPGLLASAKTPKNLVALIRNCIDPSKSAFHTPGRLHAPNVELAMRLYNEMKRLSKVQPSELRDEEDD